MPDNQEGANPPVVRHFVCCSLHPPMGRFIINSMNPHREPRGNADCRGASGSTPWSCGSGPGSGAGFSVTSAAHGCRQRVGKLATLFLAWLMVPPFCLPGQEIGRIRIQTTLVNVPVMVRDQRGGVVSGLKSEDFHLYDDGIRQPVAFFAAAAEPIRVALLIDTSKSTATVLDKMRKAAAGFLDELRPKDEAMVVTFDSEIRVLGRFGSDLDELKREIRRVEIGDTPGTHLCDAAVRVAQRYLRAGQGRNAMILLTDGQDYGSAASPGDMIRAILDSGVVAYSVFYKVDRRALVKKLFGVSLSKSTLADRDWEAGEKAGAELLIRLAEDSAGAFFPSDVTDLKKTFGRVADELRHQYLLAFYPDPARLDGTQHSIHVDLSRSDLQSRARRNYVAAKDPSR
jgi:VWFA-related protein